MNFLKQSPSITKPSRNDNRIPNGKKFNKLHLIKYLPGELATWTIMRAIRLVPILSLSLLLSFRKYSDKYIKN